jgi:hypothetical protein
MGERIAFDIHSAAILYSLGVTFMPVHHFLEHSFLPATGFASLIHPCPFSRIARCVMAKVDRRFHDAAR